MVVAPVATQCVVTFRCACLLVGVNGNDVLIVQNVLDAAVLRLVLHRRAPHQRVFELCNEALVDTLADVLDRGVPRHNDRVGEVRPAAAGLGEEPDEAQVLPQLVQHVVEVELLVARDDSRVLAVRERVHVV